MKHTLFITGAAGYVGSMLIQQFAKRDDVERIIGLDKEPLPEMLKDQKKLVYVHKNTTDDWQAEIGKYNPDIVIHTAWQIRELYGNRALTWKWNIDGSDNVFDFAFSTSGVTRLIYFSTVSSYGAFSTNTLDHLFTEDEPFRKSEYLYAEEKRIAEEHLEKRYAKAVESGSKVQVSVVRPAAITGPRGRFMRIRFGLQSALSGQLKDSFAYRMVSAMVSFVPVTPKWLRQFIHEDDVTDLIEVLAFNKPKNSSEAKAEIIKAGQYEVFNICPPGPAVLGPDMAKAVGKRTVKLQPWMIRIPFFFMWHLTRGKIPTGPGAWRGYSYPIAVDGSKLTRMYGYEYKYKSLDAFYYTDGRYEEFVPTEARRSAKKG